MDTERPDAAVRPGAALARRSVRQVLLPAGTRQQRPETASGAAVVASGPVRILGLDPGSRATGFAVIDWVRGGSAYVASGAIRTAGASFPERLQEIFAGVTRLVGEYRPDEVAIERVFMHRNPDSALKLGQARGAALCGTFAAQASVHEYAPREIKLAVVGTGGAGKEQVQHMVQRLLGLSGTPGPDAADALAVALCHAHARRLRALTTAALPLRAGAAR